MTHPMQKIERADDGVIRFKQNQMVRHLLDWASERGMDLNEMALLNFPREDWEQFAQLIGYSVSGFGDLSYASPEVVAAADIRADRLRAAEIVDKAIQ